MLYNISPLKIVPTSYIRRTPKGIMLILCPWNFPINLFVVGIAAGIAAGNCVCMKPSEITPNCE